MAKIKSFSVGNGDMFYIKHDSDNFSVIDCNLTDDTDKEKAILKEINNSKQGKSITRFISTHPDQDHISGLKNFDKETKIINFYCVENKVEKQDETVDFKFYKNLRDSEKAFYIKKGSTRKWMNNSCDERKSAGIDILWPNVDNQHYMDALKNANNGKSPNNISPIIKYSETNATFLWMGDLETEFMNNILEEVDIPKVHILFAPHHGRESGTVPNKWLDSMNPDIIIVGEASSQHLNYYSGYKTITQNSAGDITFYTSGNDVDIYCSSAGYSVQFLENKGKGNKGGEYYLGSLGV